MAIEILMPALSPTMEEGTLAKWLVKPGDTVEAGQVIAEIETDKATMEYEAAEDGVMAELLVPEGTQGIAVNTAIARMQGDGEAPAPAPAAPVSVSASPSPAAALPAPVPSTTAAAAPSTPPAPASPRGERIFATPLARRLAAERGFDLAGIAGSGPGGRIVRADVDNHVPATAAPSPAPTMTPAPALAAPAAGPDADQVARMYQGRDYDEVTLDGMRRTIATRLSAAKQQVPHFYLRRSVALDELLALRAQLNDGLAARGVKLSINDFIIKACALALQQVPDTNVVWAGDRIFRLQPSDVAVAVAVEGGLFTPVIKDAQVKSLSALSVEMKDLAARARDRRLAPDEYVGGAMAVSNLGMYGIEDFAAIINPPQSSILAVGTGQRRPVVMADGSIGTETRMNLVLSVDHRSIDGALGAEFLQAIIANLEAPLTMLA